MERRPLTVRVAMWSATHPWRAMALWVLFVAASIAVGAVVDTRQVYDNGVVGETARANEMIRDGGLPAEPAVERILISARTGALDRPAGLKVAADAAARMRALPGVSEVEGPVTSPDGSALLLTMSMAGDPKTADERVQPLLETTVAVQRDHPALRVEQVGPASIKKAIGDTIDKDLERAEWFSLPVTLVILLVAFGALIAAGVPVVLGLSAVGSAVGLTALTSYLVPADEAATSVILLIGLAVGVDYSLFYLKREREERARGRRHLEAVEIAAATSGHAVVVSATAVTTALAGMFLTGDAIFSSIAIGVILVVGVAMLGSLTVLPAMLAKLGRWVDRPRIPLLWRLRELGRHPDARPAGARFWPTILRPALRHPLVTLLLSAGALLALAAPAFGLTLKLPAAHAPHDTAVMQAYARMTEAFPDAGLQHVVVAQAAPGQAGQLTAALDDLAARAGAHPLFAPGQRPEVGVSADNTTMLLRIATPHRDGTDDGRRSLELLRDELLPATLGTVAGVEYAVTGEEAESADYTELVRRKLPYVVGFVLALTFLGMTWTFRSVVVSVTAIGLNLLSVGAAYGVLVLVFQDNWAEGLLDFSSNGGITSWLPLTLFVILFGLSMDYHIFVLTRIREAVQRGVPTREAVAAGIASSAGVVTSAAAVMVAVFSIFVTLDMLEMKQLGVGLASAILIDATIIRAVVLPSLMTLFGEANWWAPRFLRPHGTAAAQPAEPEPEPELTAVG